MVGPCGSGTTRPACGSSCAYPGGRPTADPSEEAAPWAMAIEAGITEPLGARIIEAPDSRADERVATALAQLREQASAAPELAPLAKLLDEPRVADLIGGILAGSPYLGALIERDPARLQRLLTRAPETRLAELSVELAAELQATL